MKFSIFAFEKNSLYILHGQVFAMQSGILDTLFLYGNVRLMYSYNCVQLYIHKNAHSFDIFENNSAFR